MCSFAERRKLAFGSDSSTFFFAHFRTSGFASRRVGRYVLCKHKINYELRITNYDRLCGVRSTKMGKCRGNPCDCPYSVFALLFMRQFAPHCWSWIVCTAGAWASGCVRDRSGYETLNQLRITNYELRKGKSRETRLTICMRRVRADSPTRSRLRQGARPKKLRMKK